MPSDPAHVRVQRGLFLPPFGELADPAVVADLAVEAEAAGYDGFFLWDHVQYRRDSSRLDAEDAPPPDLPVADPWVTLTAVAAATSRLRIGPLVTPLPRRRPHVLARQVASLDVLSQGRVILGVGLGGDNSREFSAFGEETDPRTRGAQLDEALGVLTKLWSGEVVGHDGPHYRADHVRFLPTPVQSPRPPIWVAGRWPNRAPLERAARWDGFFPIEVDGPGDLADAVGALRDRHGGDLDGYDVVAQGEPGADPAPWVEAGATWWLTSFGAWDVTVEAVREAIDSGPPPI